MILSDKSIKERLCLDDGDAKKLIISPFVEDNIQPASYDITLSDSFAAIKKNTAKTVEKLNLKDCNSVTDAYEHISTDSYVLYPKKFVLASIKEYIELPNDLSAFVEGRSSIGRIGLFIQNAGWIDPGFSGEITLELYNAGPKAIILETGQRIAQLIFAETTTPVGTPYNGKYNGQRGATPSKIFEDKEYGNN